MAKVLVACARSLVNSQVSNFETKVSAYSLFFVLFVFGGSLLIHSNKIIYVYKALRSLVNLSVCHVLFVPGGQTICLSPGDKQFVCPPGTNISYTQ